MSIHDAPPGCQTNSQSPNPTNPRHGEAWLGHKRPKGDSKSIACRHLAGESILAAVVLVDPLALAGASDRHPRPVEAGVHIAGEPVPEAIAHLRDQRLL